MEDVQTASPKTATLICGACRWTCQGHQVPDFCGRCGTVGAPWLMLRPLVSCGSGASMRVQLESTFHGEWDERERAAWEARLGSGT